MKSMKMGLLSLLFSLPILASSSVQADDKCCPPKEECCQDWCSGWTLGVDFLYWMPCISDFHYALSSDNLGSPGSSNTIHYFEPEWEPGVRVTVGKENIWNCIDFTLVYSYVEFSDSDSASTGGSNTALSRGWPASSVRGGSASIDWELEYQTIEGIVTYEIDHGFCSDAHVAVYSGFRAMLIDEDRHDRLYDGSTIYGLRQNMEYWGFGSLFGIQYGYDICDCLKFFGSIDFSFLAGQVERKDRFTQTGSNDYVVTADDDCYCMPGWHLMKGISYDMCLCDTVISLRVGYEYTQWLGAPTLIHYDDSASTAAGVITSDGKRNFALHGMFLGLSLDY